MPKAVLAVLAAGLLAGLALAFWPQLKPAGSEDAAEAVAPTAAPVADDPAPGGVVDEALRRASSGIRTRVARDRASVNARAADQWAAVDSGRLNRMTSSVMQSLATIDAEALEDYQQRGAAGDGEAAFLVFHRLYACASAPATEDDLIGRIEEVYQGSAGQDEKVLERLSDHFTERYELCGPLPRGNAGLRAAYDWLALAVDLGYPAAAQAYLVYGKQMAQNLAIRHPEVAMEFRSRALDQLKLLRQSGLPEGFLAYAQEYRSGDLFDRDWLEVYAHARAAELSASGNHAGAEQLLAEAERHLTPEERRQARDRAEELCLSYCR